MTRWGRGDARCVASAFTPGPSQASLGPPRKVGKCSLALSQPLLPGAEAQPVPGPLHPLLPRHTRSLASKAGSQAAQEGRRPALQGVAPPHGQHLDPSGRFCTSFMHTRDSPRKLGVRGTLNGQQAEPEEAHEAIPGRRGVFLTFSRPHVAPSHPHLLRAKEDTRSPPGARARHGQSRAWRCLV